MEKKSNKKLFIILAAAAVIIAGVVVVLLFTNKKDVYRLLKVFEVEGKANVNRAEIGDIEPYANMVLESGDRISLDTGKMTLLADEDKYIYLEEDTELILNATGDSQNSKTEIQLLKGAITNEIQNKLSDESVYDINTPNSTMSVRGTIYRVCVYEIDGVRYTRVQVFDGEVVTRLVYKDGTVDTREVSVTKGKEVTIYEDDKTTNYVSDPTDINYDELPEDVLLLLMDFNDEGNQVSITNPEIMRILDGPYYVNFMYEGQLFGTQTVKKGEKAEVPSLSPAAKGGWDYDFDKPITRDTVIEWK
jgi:flagellar basal body-associated protein FliL